ncbi:hypothetical protein LCGC14_1310610 [marine sediment metagenome]|uniref:Uncharacterized protein n=1 Tax=marine sediment metagenome TaxID=412755 RepID=A0A0F9NQ02_9ZZZZ
MKTPFSIIVGKSGKTVLQFIDQPVCEVDFKFDIKVEFLIALVDTLNTHETECSNAS